MKTKRKTKLTSLLLALCMVIAMLPTVTIDLTAFATETASTDPSEDWEYTVNDDGTVTLTKYAGTAADVYIPSTVTDADGNRLTVTALGDSVFKGNTGINSATFGEGITTIGASAFEGAVNLACIVSPETLATIGDRAFYGCSAFNSVILYDTVTSIGTDTFAGCSSVTVWCNEGSAAHTYAVENSIPYVIISESAVPDIRTVNGIKYYIMNGEAIAISFDGSYTDVTIPAMIYDFPVVELRGTFDGHSLSNIEFPSTLKRIGESAFANCKLSTITVPANVVEIGSSAFSKSTLTSVYILGDNTTIGGGAFLDCVSLKKAQLPQNLTILEAQVFWGCSTLETIDIPDGVTSLGYQVFAYCYNLNNVIIPSSITTVKGNAFQSCLDLTDVFYSGSRKSWDSISIGSGNGYLTGATIHYAIKTPVAGISLSDTEVELFVSDSYQLTYLLDPEKPDNEAVTWTSSDSSVATVDNGKVIAKNPGEAIITVKTEDGSYTAQCEVIVSLPSGNTDTMNWQIDDNGVLCIVGTSIPDYVAGSAPWFKYASMITAISIDNEITDIGDYSFYKLNNISNIAFSENIIRIGKYAFANCNNLCEVSFSDKIEEIGEYAFYNCSELKNVVLPKGITDISEYTFAGCSTLETVTFPDTLISIGRYAYANCTLLTTPVLPESIECIDNYAFYKCDKITNIILPINISSIYSTSFAENVIWCVYEGSYAHTYAMENNLLYSITENGEAPQVYEEDGVSYLISENSAIAIAYSGETTQLVIPASINNVPVTEIRETFRESSIVSIVLPNSISKIDKYAFYNCKSLEKITLPENLLEIADYTFYNCIKLSGIEFPDGITNIGSYAFYACTTLSDLNLPENLQTIANNAFGRCMNLSIVSLPEGLIKIDSYAFFNCVSIESVVIPVSVESISLDSFFEETFLGVYEGSYSHQYFDEQPDNILYYITKNGEGPEIHDVEGVRYFIKNNEAIPVKYIGTQKDIIVPASVNGYEVTSIGDVFSGTALTSISLPESISLIPSEAFSNCTALKRIDIGDNVTQIGYQAFYNCTQLVDIIIPCSLVSISDSAFSKSSQVKNVYITDIKSWCNIAFADGTSSPLCSSGNLYLNNELITNLQIPEGVKEIKQYAFIGCTSLKTVSMADSVLSISDRAFSGCSNMEAIEFSNNLQTIGTLVFNGCKSLKTVELPDSIQTIDEWTFNNCTSLQSVKFPTLLSTIPPMIFWGCVNLERVLLPKNATTLSWNAFDDSSKLSIIVIPKTVTSIYNNTFTKNAIFCVYQGSYAHNYAIENGYMYFVLKETLNPEISYGAGVSGVVTTTDGTPIVNATVEIIYDDGVVKETVTTDDSGAYAFTYAEVGAYTVRATDTSGNSAAERVSVKRMNAFDVFLTGETDIVLKSAWTVSGNVSPASATVTLTDTDGNIIESVDVTSGEYSFENIPNGSYIVKAETESGSAVKEITVFNGDVAVEDITVSGECAVITGDVEVEDREYNRHKRIWVEVTLYNSEGVAVAQTKTDENGAYTFKGLPLDDYAIVAETSEMRPDKHKHFDRYHKLTGFAYVSATEAATYTADTIVLTEENDNLTEISGKVTAQGETQDCEVTLANVFRHEVASCRTGKNGKYTFKNVRDGLYFITARTNGNGMGFTAVLVRHGKVYGKTDITVYKPDKIKNREDSFPKYDSKDHARNYRDRIAEEKRWYDSLSEKEKKHCSKDYVDRLNQYCEWVSEFECEAPDGAVVHNGGQLFSGDELENDDTFTLTLKITDGSETAIDENGIQTDEQFVQQSIHDAAGDRTIAKYYNISLSKKDGKGTHEIKSIARDTDTTGKVRITMSIPEEYRGHKHYHFVHIHNGEPKTLIDLDNNPDTITFEVDRFSTFALTYTDEVLSVDGEVESEEETEEVTNFGTRNACIRAMLSENTKCQVTLLSGIDGLNYRAVGFEVTVGETTRMLETKTVYMSVSALSAEGTRISVAPEQFGGNSLYIFGSAISFGESFAAETLTYRPYAIDFSGNYIYGKTSTISPIFKEVTE